MKKFVVSPSIVVLSARTTSFTSPPATRCTKLSICKSPGTYPVHREITRPRLNKHRGLPRVFDRHHFLDILDHADRRMITLAVDTDSTHVIVAYIMADLTIFDITTKCQQRGRKPFRVTDITAKHMERQPECCFPPHSRQ